jgi:tRNA(fMet)-specific endonuclease VapC
MKRYVLDTDMLTLYQLGNPAVVRQVTRHLREELAVTVLTVEEQLTGWYTRLRRAKRREELARVYQHLTDGIELLAQLKVLSFATSS